MWSASCSTSSCLRSNSHEIHLRLHRRLSQLVTLGLGSPPLRARQGECRGGGKPAVDAAFLATFGITQSDPNVANITSAQMSNFLDNQFTALFADPAWSTDWSTASNQNLTQRISPNEKIETSVNANDTAMRK